MLSKLVGATGHVTGVDMTEEQLEVARRHLQFHADAFGFKESNVSILKGQIEDLESKFGGRGGISSITPGVVCRRALAKRILPNAYCVLRKIIGKFTTHISPFDSINCFWSSRSRCCTQFGGRDRV